MVFFEAVEKLLPVFLPLNLPGGTYLLTYVLKPPYGGLGVNPTFLDNLSQRE
jgi:hypothetical protein